MMPDRSFMPRLCMVITAAFALLLCAYPSKGGLLSGGTGQTHLGVVATRGTTVNIGSDATAKYFQSKSAHDFPLGGYGFQIVLIGWRGDSTDVATGYNASVSAEFEYPAGTCTSILFSGSSSGTVPNNGQLVSDAINVTVPLGARGWVHIGYYNNGAGTLYYGGLDVNATIGDAMQTSATPISHTPCQAPTTNVGSVLTTQSGPAAIIAQTNRPSLCLGGDSIGYGRWDSSDSTGNLGYMARSIGPYIGYINQSLSASSLSMWTSSSASKRIALAQAYCTHFIFQGGINNLFSLAQSAAVVQAALQVTWAAFCVAPIKCYQTTITPMVDSSSDSYATLGGQTVNSNSTARATVNTYIRTTPSPLVGYFDPAIAFMESGSTGKWNVNGTANWCTDDGLHQQRACALGAVANGVIPQGTFTWP